MLKKGSTGRHRLMTESRHALPYRAQTELPAGRVIVTEGNIADKAGGEET